MAFFLLLLTALRLFSADYTALDRYIAAPDSSYQYSLARTINVPGATAYQLNMVSQTWLTTAEVDRPQWRHWVTILRPAILRADTALLYINGGSNSETPPTPDALLAAMAVQAGMIVINLGQVPNQPLRFAGETQTRTEDAIIAYTWDKFLRTGDERWPARLPMTKAAVRAMDATSEFLAKLPDPVTVRNYIVAGGSKRGWTTWTAAAVDPRVVAIAPIVIDTLNMQASFVHHWRAYGFWAPAVTDYVNAGVMNWFQTPQIDALAEIEDPYQYRDRLTLPKYLLCSSGDQFFLPDNSQFYFSDLPGEKYLRYVPNTDHGMNSPETALNLIAWLRAITSNFPRPRFSFRADRPSGVISVRTLDKPTEVLLWQATNPQARDFRLESVGPIWKSTPLRGENGIYIASPPPPAQGFTAFFIELRFPGPDDLPLVFTTEVVVTPDVYPFDPPAGAQ